MSTKLSNIGRKGWDDDHRELYFRTNGQEGHYVDFSAFGGHDSTPCLILKTIGRNSGAPKMLPLIYGQDGRNFVIVASKGGAPKHPAWYLNLSANPDVEIQVADKKYKARARVAQGEERQRLWDMMVQVYPPYTPYQEKTEREIPVVVLEPVGEIETL